MTAIDRLRKLYEAASPGDWDWQEFDGTVFHSGLAYCEVSELSTPEDAALIVAMRNHLPLLLDLVEAADKMRARLEYPVTGVGLTDRRRELLAYDTARAALESVLSKETA